MGRFAESEEISFENLLAKLPLHLVANYNSLFDSYVDI